MKVLVTARMPEEVLALIRQDHQVENYDANPPIDRQKLLRSIVDKEGLLCTITDRIDTEVLDRALALKVIANYGVGFEHIDIDGATQRGIPVTNTRRSQEATAEPGLGVDPGSRPPGRGR